MIVADDKVYFSYQTPVVVNKDPRPFVKHYFHAIDVSDPAAPKAATGVNVPGDVIAADSDTIYTRDLVWDDTQTETMVARLTMASGLAHLKAQHLFEKRVVNALQLDGAGHILVSHDGIWNYYSGNSSQSPVNKLTLLDQTTLSSAGETEIDSWATFMTAKAGRAVFSVSGGVLIVNTEDASNPHAQAYFPTTGYGSTMLLDGSDLIFAAGPYGIYRFGSNTYNLLAK